jgi:hypothetical protein
MWIYNGPTIGENSVQAQWRDVSGTGGSYYTEDAGAGSPGIPLSQQVYISANQWVFAEVYYKYNDVGQTNGLFYTALNGAVWQNRTAVQVRANAGEYIGFVQPIPSMDLEPNPAEYDYAMSRVYIDVGPQSVARVYLSDSSTAAGVKKKFILPASAWAADSVTVTDAASIPSGYQYVYVTNVSGETNSAGFVLGGTQVKPNPPLIQVN